MASNATGNEEKIFYLKLKGDYNRYLAEYSTGETLTKSQGEAMKSYEQATKIANQFLKATDPARLGLALNAAVFQYEVLNDPSEACRLAKCAFDEAIADIENLESDGHKDSTTIMQLIRDNLVLWTGEIEGEEGGD